MRLIFKARIAMQHLLHLPSANPKKRKQLKFRFDKLMQNSGGIKSIFLHMYFWMISMTVCLAFSFSPSFLRKRTDGSIFMALQSLRTVERLGVPSRLFRQKTSIGAVLPNTNVAARGLMDQMYVT